MTKEIVIRKAAQHLVHLRYGTLDSLKDLERMLVENVEGALDALVGGRLDMDVVEPRRKGVQDCRQHDRRDHHQLQEPNCRLPRAAHQAIIPWSGGK